MVPHSIWDVITEISHFVRDLCAIEIHVDHMETLQGKICETICKLEKIFPLGCFDYTEHLPIHLPYKVKVFATFEEESKNRASVEGSICEAYIIEKISSFCSWYFEPAVRTRLNRVPHNDDGGDVDSLGRLSIFIHLGQAFGPLDKSRFLDEDEFYAAELYVLMNCEEVLPYIKIFDDIVKGDVVHISEDELEKVRDARFVKWFKNYVAKRKDEIDPRLLEISYGPGHMIRNRFHIPSGGDRENEIDLNEEVYQENVSTSNTGTILDELDNFTVLASGDYEEINLLIEDEEDDMQRDEDEEDDMEGDENEDQDQDQIEDDDCETFNENSDNNEKYEFVYSGSD
ncbi:Transposase tnp2 [Theobroma cacao]|uniref:Transposase tnp2 n=1 Tax=Theobroma cacao TaxID=3641 RepID=A0A061GQK0_THECC|nr:Transposase tnp2 [Theobroma cacao]